MSISRFFIQRCLFFLLGTFLLGVGVALSTRSGLGTTPISSVPYVLSRIVPLSFGTWTFLFNILFVLAQIFILRRNYDWRQLVQLAAVFLLGIFIDVGMALSAFYHPAHYAAQVVELLLGSALIAVGVSLQILSDISYVPGDGLVDAISRKFAIPFGKVKWGVDSFLVALALVLAMAILGKPVGIREGTLLAACMIGPLIHVLITRLQRVFRPLGKPHF